MTGETAPVVLLLHPYRELLQTGKRSLEVPDAFKKADVAPNALGPCLRHGRVQSKTKTADFYRSEAARSKTVSPAATGTLGVADLTLDVFSITSRTWSYYLHDDHRPG